MEPAWRPRVGLADLLDRVLDRGLLINADIIISLAGVPLIGINLRAALAGMETMARYGLLKEWDLGIRAQAAEAAAREGYGAGQACEILSAGPAARLNDQGAQHD